jgi:hypothetical protein
VTSFLLVFNTRFESVLYCSEVMCDFSEIIIGSMLFSANRDFLNWKYHRLIV